MLYLSRFYALFWSLVATCVLGVLSSRFSFIVPFVFYNKYIATARTAHALPSHGCTRFITDARALCVLAYYGRYID